MATKGVSGDVSTADPRVICVVVNWNGWKDTVECLRSLKEQSYARLEVIVVDNGSTNGSAERIREAHPWVEIVETGQNLGFPRGCNVGTRMACARGADLVWLLNNDTIAPPDTASKLVAMARAHPEAGAIGSVLYYMHDPAGVQAWGGGEIDLRSGYVSHFRAPARFERETTFFTGASVLIPRRIFEEVGVFFEGFFMYCDDSDLCIRIHRAGYRLVVAEDTAILHKEGGSSPKRSPQIDQFATISTLRMLGRHARAPWMSQMIFLALRLANRVRRREWNNLMSVWQGAAIYLRERGDVYSDRL